MLSATTSTGADTVTDGATGDGGHRAAARPVVGGTLDGTEDGRTCQPAPAGAPDQAGDVPGDDESEVREREWIEEAEQPGHVVSLHRDEEVVDDQRAQERWDVIRPVGAAQR